MNDLSRQINPEIEASAIDIINQLLALALKQNASDIHLEPYESSCRVRLRCDGQLFEVQQLPLTLSQQVCMRLKVLAQLNIAEKRLPQDGCLHFGGTSTLDLRISTCPTLFGEKIVLRLLNQKKSLSLDALGLALKQHETFIAHLQQPHGMIIVSGPTGSGKTVTLYAALSFLNTIAKNIMTVEDPIEIKLAGVNQVNVNPPIGFDFPQVLRAFLRQDPDIIMIGEIRDSVTAKIALQAAQTGHLVLATIHANHTLAALERLQTMGLPKLPLLKALSLVLAQRLVRKVCGYCAGVGACVHCHAGYAGRTGIFECLTLNSLNVPQLVNDLTLWQAGLLKIKNGMTTPHELKRVLGSGVCG